jgi:hypothetical protein
VDAAFPSSCSEYKNADGEKTKENLKPCEHAASVLRLRRCCDAFAVVLILSDIDELNSTGEISQDVKFRIDIEF